jgi:hypothetical protein
MPEHSCDSPSLVNVANRNFTGCIHACSISTAVALLQHISEQSMGSVQPKPSSSAAVLGLQETTEAQCIQHQRQQDNFNALLKAKVHKAAGAAVTIPVRYELERQDDSSPMVLSAEPLQVCRHLSV